jgi:FkbM family methyltransferase
MGLLRAVTTAYPFNTPRASILRRLPLPPPDFGEISGKDGVRYRSYTTDHDDVSHSLFWFGDFDPWVIETLRRFAVPGSTALDIGANIGATSLPLAKAVGPEGFVVCFEPCPVNAERLDDNLRVNAFHWARIERVALSDKCGSLHMMIPEGRAARARVAQSGKCMDVKAMRFDDWVESSPIRQFSVCKIDVEDHEPEVFAGMTATLAQKRIRAFVFERHGNPGVSDPVFTLLRGAGYSIFRIEKGLRKVHYVPVEKPPRARSTPDFLAVHAAVDMKAGEVSFAALEQEGGMSRIV